MTQGLRGARTASPSHGHQQLQRSAIHSCGKVPPPWRVRAFRIATDVEPEAAITLDVLRAGGWSSLRLLQDHYGHLEHSRIDHVVTHATNVLDHGPLIDVTPNTKEDPS